MNFSAIREWIYPFQAGLLLSAVFVSYLYFTRYRRETAVLWMSIVLIMDFVSQALRSLIIGGYLSSPDTVPYLVMTSAITIFALLMYNRRVWSLLDPASNLHTLWRWLWKTLLRK